jgi:hypothetical protein
MVSPYNIPTTIQIAEGTQVQYQIDAFNKEAFHGGSIENYLPVLIYMERKTLQWLNTNDPTYASIDAISGYVYALCSDYSAEVLNAIGQGSGISVIPQQGNSLAIEEYREDFVVDGIPTSRYPITAGNTTYTVPLSGFLTAFWIPGGTIAPNAIPGAAGTTSIDKQSSFLRFNLNQAVASNEVYTVWGLRVGNKQAVPNTGPQIPLPLDKGKFLTNDGTVLLWDNVIAEYTSANFQPDGITVIDTTLANYSYDRIVWNNVPTTLYLSNGDFTPIVGGGFVINIPDFNAGLNPDWTFTILKKG